MKKYPQKQQYRALVTLRIAGILFLTSTIAYISYVLTHINHQSPFTLVISSIFAGASVLICINGVIHVINNWSFTFTKLVQLPHGEEPTVAVLIPTYDEDISIVLHTVVSITSQDWPKDKRIIIVSDDGHRPELRVAIDEFKAKFQEYNLIYHRPPRKNSPLRRGEAKAGNLNSALEVVLDRFPYINFIETRDADDIVGNKHFLRYCIQALQHDTSLSFVQTIKRCIVTKGDPFSNLESIFYERTMPARLAANAVFPCGSGLVWRLSELKKIGGFPSWNLVEDLQSGYEILQRGGKGEYLPIIGAIGQIAPEDIPNFYKQRGTWALDSLRLFLYKNPLFKKSLTFRQKIQFFDMGYTYILSLAIPIFIINLCLSLIFNIFPIQGSGLKYVALLALFTITYELFNAARSWNISTTSVVRSRQAWLGLMPVFIAAIVKALWYGPHTKPNYRVTRKYHTIGWYWRETLVQSLAVLILTIAVVFNIVADKTHSITDLASLFWAVFFIMMFSRTIRNSWAGINVWEKFDSWKNISSEQGSTPLTTT